MNNIRLPPYFVLLERCLGNSARVAIDVVVALEAALPHPPVLAHRRAPAAPRPLLAEIGVEEEVPAVDLVVPPLPDHEVAVVLDGDA